MKKTLSAFTLFAIASFAQPLYAITAHYKIQQKEIHNGFIVERIWLSAYAVPQVTVSAVTYNVGMSLPERAKISDPQKFSVVLGMDRKRPFMVVRVPAYVAGTDAGKVNEVSGFTIDYNEQPHAAAGTAAAKTTDVASSVLATGAWYKLAVTKTGFYKIDNTVLTSMGLGTANLANIRIYGNGGRMLAEDNAVPRATDLVENAVWLSNGAAVFYAKGPTDWNTDGSSKRYTHVKNLYVDTSYYFVTFDKGAGLRPAAQPAVGAANVTVTSFDHYEVHDTDMVNPAGLGKLWYGEKFHPALNSLSQTFTFDVGPSVSCVHTTVSFAGTCGASGSTFGVTLNGASIGAGKLGATTGDDVMALNSVEGDGACNANLVNVAITYSPIDASGVGYLNYIELNLRRNLAMTGDQLSFRDWQSVGADNIANYQLQGANSSTSVWDITDAQHPVLMNGALSGSTYSFTQEAATLHEFAAINSTNVFTPKFAGKVDNQDLHGLPLADLLIVVYPDFADEAQQLAEYHRQHDNMKVVVATVPQIYNEFSSGQQDLSAIRDFARMFYKRAGSDSTKMPKYMLLFGGGSYDYKNRIPNNSNFVPVYEYKDYSNDLTSYSSDDFYGFLDDSENIENNNKLNVMDLAVGRLPARSKDDAAALVSKIISYTKPATLGPWRLSSTFAACRNDNAGTHMLDAETMSGDLQASSNGLYNVNKVYQDALPIISTPAGARAPAASSSINNAIFKGTLMINYNGHGNTEVLSSERILTQDDYNSWNNPNMLPFMVTATCDYGQFDHPQYVSAAEHLVIRRGGGAIVMLTTTQAVFAVYNKPINEQYINAQFTRKPDGTWNTFGDATRISKNLTYFQVSDDGELANFRKFALLGDPALTPAFPKYAIQLDNVTDGVTGDIVDSIKALGKYVLTGSVTDNSGTLFSNFNGQVYVSLMDKPRNITTITAPALNFKLQDNIVYKGKVTVTNGHFSITFIAPKDINYFYGTGKLSTYADNGEIDAAGADTSLKIGGFSEHPQYSVHPPEVKPYINDSLFLNGGITGSNTSLFVSLFSETGINVTGNNIGHDLTAVLDGNIESPYILNDYYETAPNTYQRGFISFPLAGLANGRHTITVKAWDVNDNAGTGSVDFMVVDGKVVDIKNLVNYPNPFSTETHFVFEHNHPDELLETEIGIYSTSGALVRTIKASFTPSGSRTSEITWDGTDNNGAQLPAGVYVYRLNIATEKGFRSSAYQKLVIVR